MKINQVIINEFLNVGQHTTAVLNDYNEALKNLKAGGEALDANNFKEIVSQIFVPPKDSKDPQIALPWPTDVSNGKDVEWLRKAAALNANFRLWTASEAPPEPPESPGPTPSPGPGAMDVEAWINFFNSLSPADQSRLKAALGITP